MRILLVALLFVCFNPAIGQDTTMVQTIQFSDITKRRGWYVLPTDTVSYRQILMYYTLKCDPATTQDGFDCGEWDYTTYTNLYQYQNVGAHAYTANGSRPDTIFYTPQQFFDYHQSHDYFIVYDVTSSETDHTVGSGSVGLNSVFQSNLISGKSQFIYTAADLNSAGLSAGDIHKLRMDVSSVGSPLSNLTLKMKNSGLLELTPGSYETNGMMEVFNGNVDFGSTGFHTINFTIPFNWDGTSNIVVEFSFTNSSPGLTSSVDGDNAGFNSGVVSSENEEYLDFSESKYIEVPSSALANVDSFITVSFWQYGDPATQPSNTYLFEGVDGNNNRVVNAHLPWSNGRVYWDAGNSGTGSYDRIDKLANFNDYAGKWNHWAFVKNVALGQMQVYLNGNLWHSGSSMSRTMDGIQQFKIAARGSGNGGRYNGGIDEFRIWNAALTQTEILDWMNKKVNPSHPQYADLILAYDFNASDGLTTVDYSVNGNDGILMGVPTYKVLSGDEIHSNITQVIERPNLTFVQGVYVTHLDSTVVLDSIPIGQISITEEATSRNLAGSGITFAPIDTIYGYPANIWTYTYDPYGVRIDSAFISPTNQLINLFNSKTHQIQNYVTPYGIGLNLGPNGFRWVYDVTDYARILSDTIEISAGNQQELLDLKFMFVSGTPPRDIIDFETLWLGDYQHEDIANDIVMPALDVQLNNLASQYTVRTRTTGHWFGGFQNCAEFCPKLHNLSIDGTQQFEWLNWKECSDNPVVDQGGTWIYDRAGWCPGTFAETFNHNITPYVTPGGITSIDYGMEVTSGGMEGNYRTTVQLISYADYNFNLDASIVDVIAPNKWEFYNRLNPICGVPVIRIKNTGSDTLKSLDIVYRVKGGVDVLYQWTGVLAFGEEEEVELYPVGGWFWSSGNGTQIFEAEIKNPNGGVDQLADNNIYRTEFDLPPVLPEDWYLWYRSNNAGAENSYFIYDMFGDTLYSSTNWSNNTVYRDTFHLDPGCYTLEIVDSDEDGVSFFANNDGNGWIRWRPVSGGAIYNFQPNFGDRIIYNFLVGGVLGVEESNEPYLNIFPNPTDNVFNIESEGFHDDVTMEVYGPAGRLLMSRSFSAVVGSVTTQIDMSSFSEGTYFLKMSDGKRMSVKQLIKL